VKSQNGNRAGLGIATEPTRSNEDISQRGLGRFWGGAEALDKAFQGMTCQS
jgi:hypothetical protein